MESSNFSLVWGIRFSRSWRGRDIREWVGDFRRIVKRMRGVEGRMRMGKDNEKRIFPWFLSKCLAHIFIYCITCLQSASKHARSFTCTCIECILSITSHVRDTWSPFSPLPLNSTPAMCGLFLPVLTWEKNYLPVLAWQKLRFWFSRGSPGSPPFDWSIDLINLSRLHKQHSSSPSRLPMSLIFH